MNLETCATILQVKLEDESVCKPLSQFKLGIMVQISDGLCKLHEENIVHRDLKPENILFCIKGDHLVAKLADFGLSKEWSKECSNKVCTCYVKHNNICFLIYIYILYIYIYIYIYI